MAASASFGSGERFYHNICPVTHTEGKLACKQCGMIRYSSGEAAAIVPCKTMRVESFPILLLPIV